MNAQEIIHVYADEAIKAHAEAFGPKAGETNGLTVMQMDGSGWYIAAKADADSAKSPAGFQTVDAGRRLDLQRGETQAHAIRAFVRGVYGL